MIISDIPREFRLAPTGLHMARLFSVVDLGHQSTEWAGKVKIMHKVDLTWELHGNDDSGNPLTTDAGKPLIVYKRYTVSLGDQSTLRKDLESWSGKKMTAEDRKNFDVRNLLGKFCMVNITHSDDGKFANISAISPVPSALRDSKPEGINPTKSFWLKEFKQEEYDALSNYHKEKIEKSSEWRGQQEREKNAPKLADDDGFGPPPF
jgi:hypothetical protein